jgi:hypothetical protein
MLFYKSINIQAFPVLIVMKTIIAFCCAVIFLFAAIFQTRADILAGPIVNSVNGHSYYLLTQNTWTASEAEAENLGGTLAIIKNADEQKWVYSTFENYGGANHGGLWIGLHRTRLAGPFAWVTDKKLDYANWGTGQPDNAGGIETCVHMNGDGTWNDLRDDSILYGVVEMSNKENKESLSRQERALIGNWYEAGKIEQPCWIAGTDDALFIISHDKLATRASLCADGSLFVPPNFPTSWMSLHGEIIKDKILWSNGTWWSRKPVDYQTSETSSANIESETQ